MTKIYVLFITYQYAANGLHGTDIYHGLTWDQVNELEARYCAEREFGKYNWLSIIEDTEE